MQPSWKQIYPWIEAAVVNLESTDTLLQQVVGRLAMTYRADCLIWAGLETGLSEMLRVYATPRPARQLQQSQHFIHQPIWMVSKSKQPKWQQAIQKFHPLKLPVWLQQQRQSPTVAQLTTGDLIMPATSGGHAALPAVTSLQFVIQLHRPTNRRSPNNPMPLSPFRFELAAQAEDHPSGAYTGISNWSLAEIFSLEVLCSQLILAYNALYWRQRLEQSRQQAALMGRITQLLNSSLNPDEIVKRIVAELGQGLKSDRSILLDLRGGMVKVLSIWDDPEQQLQPFPSDPIHQDLWSEAVDMFILGGASYLELDLSQDQTGALQAWLRQMGVITALMVPLFIQEEFFGGVLLLSYQARPAYQLDQLQTIRQVVDQAAIALTNAQHYQSLWTKQEALRIQNNSLQLEIIRDDLTHLLNRRSLEHELEEMSAPALWALHPVFTIIVCDIDYFKLVNDTHGHLVGDEVLYGMAQRIQQRLRQGTTAYRYGGEEFVMILTEASQVAAVEVAERLRAAIRSEPFETKIGPIKITASFGVAQQDPELDPDAKSVLQRADQALYEAKRQGRDRVVAL